MKPPKEMPRGPAVRFPVLAAVAVAFVLAPTLARTPQSGDGAEIVRAAVQGGVLHPPGFPLQAWLDRALVGIPGVNPALAIAVFGLACHAATAGILVAMLAHCGVGMTGALAGAAAFALFPSTWRVAVEPEVFAPAALFTAILLWLAMSETARKDPMNGRGRRRARGAPPVEATAHAAPAAGLAAGLAGGLGAATHPIFLAALPALAVALVPALRAGPRRRVRIALALLALGIPPLALYLSLPLLRSASPWPDWGALDGPADVLRHALRLEYGGVTMSAAGSTATESALGRWAADILRVWNVAIAFAIAGAWSLRGRAGARGALAVLGTLAASLAILALGRLPRQSYTASEFERLQGPAVLAGALLLGLGVDVFRRRLTRPALRRAFDVVVVAAAIARAILGWHAADAAGDRTLALHQAGVAAELGDAVYVTEGDLETFYGIPAGGSRRFPVMGPEMALPWYWRTVAPRLEPRVLASAAPPASWGEFLRACFARGLAVAGSSRAIVATDSIEPELRGLLWISRPGGRAAFTDSTIAAAVRLVPLAAELPVLRPGERELSRFYARRFARAFSGAGQALQADGRDAAAACADSVAGAILRALPRSERRARLDAFVRAAGESR